MCFFFELYGYHRDLHGLTHSFPTRRSSDLRLSSAWDSRLDSFFHGAFLTALILMALVTGAVLTAADIFPGPQIVRAYQGGKAFYDKLTVYDDVYRSEIGRAHV